MKVEIPAKAEKLTSLLLTRVYRIFLQFEMLIDNFPQRLSSHKRYTYKVVYLLQITLICFIAHLKSCLIYIWVIPI